MNLLLFDDPIIRSSLLPLTYLRPVSHIRIGILTIAEKWHAVLKLQPGFLVEDYLAKRFIAELSNDNLYVNGALCPDDQLLEEIKSLGEGDGLKKGNTLLCFRSSKPLRFFDSIPELLSDSSEYTSDITLISQPWHIFQKNAGEIKKDFNRITKNRKSAPINDKHTAVYHKENIFLEEGVSVKASVIDAENGPVYLGKNSKINPGSVIRGSFALLNNSELNMGAKMRGDTTIGPFSKVGGEVSNAVIFGYSNKVHDGYLGNSVIAEWCNLGAATNTSNMKNDFSNVRLWNYQSERFEDTGSTFCGLIMGDHTKTGINVMFNSGTSIGIACNLYNPGYFRNFVPSFYKGTPEKLVTQPLQKAVTVAEKTLERRNVLFSEIDVEVFQKVFEITARFRKQ